jgi:hypothetical protein
VLVWEWDGPKAVMLSGSGVIRKSGATVVWKGIEAKVTLTTTDGKVTGWTVSGRGVYPLATGDWASMAGKSFVYPGRLGRKSSTRVDSGSRQTWRSPNSFQRPGRALFQCYEKRKKLATLPSPSTVGFGNLTLNAQHGRSSTTGIRRHYAASSSG